MPYMAQALMAFLAILDYITTNYAVRRYGPQVEINPLWRFGFFKKSVLFDIFYFSGIILIITFTIYIEKLSINLALIVSLLAIVINNVIFLIKSR